MDDSFRGLFAALHADIEGMQTALDENKARRAAMIADLGEIQAATGRIGAKLDDIAATVRREFRDLRNDLRNYKPPA